MSEDTKKNVEKPWQFQPGNPGGPGRPAGSISAITRVKQIFNENPEAFEGFITKYISNPMNEKHIVEMLDGKPFQKTDITSGGERLTVNVLSFNGDTNSPQVQPEEIPVTPTDSQTEV